MNEFDKILLEEIRENRKQIEVLRNDINSVKIKIAGITVLTSTVFGIIGTYIKSHFFGK